MKMQLALSSMPSLCIIYFLYQSCLEILKSEGTYWTELYCINLHGSYYRRFINIYENYLASTELGNSKVSKKGDLHILLDLRFIGDILSGGKKSSTSSSETQVKQDTLPSTMAETSFRRKQSQFQADSATIEPINKLINKFSQKLDLIDWETYEPYLWENEKPSYMYTGAVHKLPAKTSTDSNTLRCSQVPRFKYLPISSRRSFSYGEGSRPFDQPLHVPLVQRGSSSGSAESCVVRLPGVHLLSVNSPAPAGQGKGDELLNLLIWVLS